MPKLPKIEKYSRMWFWKIKVMGWICRYKGHDCVRTSDAFMHIRGWKEVECKRCEGGFYGPVGWTIERFNRFP